MGFISINKASSKTLSFEFVLKQLIVWHTDVTNNANNDISTLKALKLLFFVTAIGSTRRSPSYLLKNVFNDFVAMPYGHVESFIYDLIREEDGRLNYYTIDNKMTEHNGSDLNKLEGALENETRSAIIDAVNALRKANNSLITYSAFDLVDLSHNWYSWKKTFLMAEKEGIRSKEIPVDIIQLEDKVYSIQMF